MSTFIKVKENKPSLLERFGKYYLQFFLKLKNTGSTEVLSDNEIERKVRRITRSSIWISNLISIVFVLPTVWAAIYFENHPFWVQYGWIAAINVLSIVFELYLLFILSLKAVTDISRIVKIETVETDFLKDGLFSVKSILARTALELPDPELEILGIDPFKRISKKNLLVIGLIYKGKIFLTNFILKNLLILFSIRSLFGFSILYEAVAVECFWNAVVMKRVIKEARLRLFGFTLATRIIAELKQNGRLNLLSDTAKKGCLRAIGNAVVMTQNYHPNMIILLLSFQKELGITTEDRYDEWPLFLQTLHSVTEKEKYFLLDLFTVAIAFDGKISALEKRHMQEAYDESYEIYYPRLLRLNKLLRKGILNQAFEECKLDFQEG